MLLCCLTMPVHAGGDALRHCLEKAQQRHAATVPIAKDCPQLLHEMRRQGMTASLYPPLTDQVTPAQLQFLLRARQMNAAAGVIGQDGLDILLAGILQPEAPNSAAAWRQAVTAWLDKLKSGDYETQYQWLLHLLRTVIPSGATVRILLYAAIALLVLISAWLVVMELYYAGVFAALPGVRRRSARSGLRPANPPQIAIDFSAADSVTPQQQVAALLDQVVAYLAARGTLPADATLTHRQLAYAIDKQALPVRDAFLRLVKAAEPVLYGRREASEAMLCACRRDAHWLLENA